jgi:threonine dehydrogenase-like Zn-dependent dehydrogenase
MQAALLHADWDPRPGYKPDATELATGKARMASAVWRRPRLSPVTLPDPSPGPGEVVIAVRACGVCGSDTHCVETDDDGYVIFSGPARFPCVLGHEYAGEVVAVGAGVRHLRVGELVAAEGMLSCGGCEACRSGLPNQCAHLDMVGFSSPGAYADFIATGERRCWSLDRLADRLGGAQAAAELGALIEPVGCAYNGIFVAGGGMTPGSHVAVFGCGPIGLGAIALARATGAATVFAFDPSPARRAVALALGADGAFDVTVDRDGAANPAAILRDQTHGWGADVIVEAAGAARVTMPWMEAALAPAGKIVYLGRTGERAPVMLDVLVSGASCIVGARGHAGGGVFPRIIRLLEHGRMDLSPLVSCRMPLRSAADAVERSRSRVDAKIMLVGDHV